MTRELTIVGLGEALFDLLPSGKALGGAPLNVACHVQQLLQHGASRHPHPTPLPEGEGTAGGTGRGVVASRVGHDELGDEILAALAARGMTADYVQRDPGHPTGTVRVELQGGQPSYDIVGDVAWDYFELAPAWEQLAGRCAAVCFGTLAQRSAQSRHVIWQFLDAAPQAVRLLDVNLRQDFYDRHVLRESCRRATLIKLNEHELPVLAELLGLKASAVDDRVTELRARCNLDAVVYTRGARGTLLVLESGPVDAPPAGYPPEPDADAVGAGDACSAGILVGWVRGLPPARTAALANHLGAFVASRHGATPDLPPEVIGLAG
jgi:fructokinase